MMMRAVQCKAWGGPKELVLEEMAVPEPKPGQVRIAVQAAGVNFADTLMIAGKYQERPDFPFVPGLEAAGEIDAVGKGVIGIKEGDRVMAILGHGAFAERALAPAEAVFHIPKSMDAMTAAGFPVAYGTSHVALRHRAHLKAGETLVVHGAAGGVGLTAVQIGKILGATVIGTARGAEKLDIAKTNGAQHLIDYGSEDVKARILELTDKRGADVILDHVGVDTWDANLRSLARGGRLVICGATGGHEVPTNLRLVFFKNLSVLGSTMGSKGELQQIVGLVESGALRPVVHTVLPLAEVARGHTLLADRAVVGKVVLRI